MLKKFKISKQIIYLLGLALLLNSLRVLLFRDTHFVYLFWNIFLAFIPLFVSSVLLLFTTKDNILKPVFIIGFVLWFIFLPNAPYVVTDFIHLGRMHGAPLMYDLFLIFTAASVSLLMGLTSIVHMEKMLLLKFSNKVVRTIIFITILFSSFGIYLGRYLRFNSWDLFVSHDSILTSLWKIFVGPNDYVNVYWYTLLFFAFTYISYLSFRSKE